jgi:hypothetical protein
MFRNRRRHHLVLVLPGALVVVTLFRVEARENTAVLRRVAISILDNDGDVRISEGKVAEPMIALQNVTDHPAEECDIGARSDRGMLVAKRACSRKPRIDMDQRRTPALCFDQEAERNGMVLRHVGAHRDNPIRVRHIP